MNQIYRMYGLRGYRDLSECCSNPALDIQHRRFILKAPTLARRPSRLEMVVSGAITDDRNANSATKSDVTRLRRERHTVPRAIERNAAQSPDPNNIHQQDIWSSRGSGASVASPRIFRDVCELAVSLRGSVIVSARMRRRALGEKRNSDGNYSSSEVFVASGWQKSSRRNALT